MFCSGELKVQVVHNIQYSNVHISGKYEICIKCPFEEQTQ